MEVKAFFLRPSPGPHLSASQSGILSLLPTRPEKWWLRRGRVKPFHPGGVLNSLTLRQLSRPKRGSQKSLWEVPAPHMGPWGETRATTPKIGAHPTSPSLQHHKTHSINDSIVVPTAPSSCTKSQLHPESCLHSEPYKPRRSYPKRAVGTQTRDLAPSKIHTQSGRWTLLHAANVREGMSEPKSRFPVTYRYQNPPEPLFLACCWSCSAALGA